MFYNKVIQEDVENEDKLSKSAVSSSLENSQVKKPRRRHTDRLPSFKNSYQDNENFKNALNDGDEKQNIKDVLSTNLDLFSNRMGSLGGNFKLLIYRQTN
jgi:hypothetical protein